MVQSVRWLSARAQETLKVQSTFKNQGFSSLQCRLSLVAYIPHSFRRTLYPSSLKLSFCPLCLPLKLFLLKCVFLSPSKGARLLLASPGLHGVPVNSNLPSQPSHSPLFPNIFHNPHPGKDFHKRITASLKYTSHTKFSRTGFCHESGETEGGGL